MSGPTVRLLATVSELEVTDAETMESRPHAVPFRPERLTVEVEEGGAISAHVSGQRLDYAKTFRREGRPWYQGYPTSDLLVPLSEAPQWVRDAVAEVTA